MRRLVLPFCLLLLLPLPLLADEEPPSAAPVKKPAAKRSAVSLDAVRKHCEWLTSVERMGRLKWEHREACADYIAKAFKEAGLQPLPGKTDYNDDHAGDERFGKIRNVVGWLPGTKAGTTKEKPGSYVIVSAHYDHLGAIERQVEKPDGTKGTQLLVAHGADDNATGVAALLEMARLLAADAKTHPLERSIVFAAWDLEEQNCIGSTAYVKSPPLPLDQMAAFVTLDQLGRSLSDATQGTLFLMGTEHCAELTKVLDTLPAPRGGSKLVLGVDFQPGYSDYVPFQAAKLPFVFVTSGACTDWHKVTDTVQRLQWPDLEARTAWSRDLVAAIAKGDRVFKWHDEPKYYPKELQGLRAAISKVEENAETLGMPDMAKAMLTNYGKYLDKVLEDGEVTLQERTNARTSALMLFRMAAQIANQPR